jgi:pimeloyl-ACP methyl ester carboxylesterase
MARALRTRFGKDIIAEFLPPSQKRKHVRVAIICDGMPSLPDKGDLLEFLSKKGFWVFHPRYRGTWESAGVFLKKSPEEDIREVIDHLPKGFRSAWDGNTYNIEPDEIYVIGGSFGGAVALMASLDPRVTASIAVSPVVDWTSPSKDEPMDWLEGFVRQAFGEGYRFASRDWKRLCEGKLHNPVSHLKEFEGSKLFIFHAKDDGVVPWRPVASFAQKTGSRFKILNRGGHLSSGRIIERYWPQIKKFISR